MSVQTGERCITAPQLRKRFGGRSDVWLWRLLNDNRAHFPRPVMVRRNRYWRLSEVEAWEEANRSKPKEEASNAA
jgi:predicted DNA-binding transcriptional regulator AlpA